MRAQDLIRTCRDTELPAVGWWRIPTSHATVSYTARVGLTRRVTARAPSASGILKITRDPGDVALALVIDASAAVSRKVVPGLGSLLGDDHVREVVLRADAIESATGGRWSMNGEIEIGDVTMRTPVTVTYHGVYRFGDDAKTWLTVHADLTHFASGGRGQRPIALVADVLAVRPRSVTAPVLTATAPMARTATN
jgi:hypothetical protein